MSIEAMSFVFSREVKSSPQKLLMLAIANRINNDTGTCFPGQALLAQECTMSLRQVSEHLGALEKGGLILRGFRHKGNERTSDEYEICGFMEWLKQVRESAREAATCGNPQHAETRIRNMRKRVVATCGNPQGNLKKNPKKETKESNSLRSLERAHEIEAKFDEIEGKGTAVAVVQVETAKAIRLPGKPERPRASRLPDDWTLPDDWRDWAVTEEKLPLEAVIREGHKFGDYWKAKAGKDAIKANWLATWRNWARRALEMAPRGAVSGKTSVAVQAKRFPDGKNYTQVFDAWIPGEDLNDILDENEGVTYEMVRKGLKAAEDCGRGYYAPPALYNDSAYKPAKGQILAYVTNHVRKAAALTKHGTVEKLCGGKVAELGQGGPMTTEIFAVSEDFIGRMERLYPVAFEDKWTRHSGTWGGGVKTGPEAVMSKFKDVYMSCMYSKHDHSPIFNWLNYGPELQIALEAKLETEIKNLNDHAQHLRSQIEDEAFA